MLNSFVSNIKSFLKVWLFPRAAINHLLAKQTSLTRVRLVISLALTYFLQLAILLVITNHIPESSDLFSWTGLQVFLAFFFILTVEIGVILSILSMVFFILTRLLGGVGTLSETKSVVFGSSVISIPIGVLIVFFLRFGKSTLMALENGDKITFYFGLQSIAVLLMLFLLIYSTIVLVKTLSEVHKISIWQSLPVVIFGVLASSVFAVMLFNLSLWRPA